MRLSRLLLTLAVCSAPLTSVMWPAPAMAQAAPQMEAPLPCPGRVNIVRVSEINPGMMDKFLQAVAAQQAWYKKAGLPDEISVMRVLEQDPATKAWKISETKAITTHIQGKAQRPANDAAWDAFVAMFKESSTIKNFYLTCMAETGSM